MKKTASQVVGAVFLVFLAVTANSRGSSLEQLFALNPPDFSL
jgi:hypothetical protein